MNVASVCIKGVCVCVLPLQENNHRPYALRHGPLSFISALLITLKVVTVLLVGFIPNQAQLSTITVNRIVQLTNEERKKVGVGTLATSPELTRAAQMKGEDMLAHQYFAHISPNGVTPWFWMTKANYSYRVAGENLAIDFTKAEDVVSAWRASPTHKENMLRSDYTETGVAVVTGEFEGGTSTIVVHMFGLPSKGVVAAKVTTSPSPTITPSSTPSPTATPSLVPAPRTPRIDLDGGSSTIQTEIPLRISGDEASTAHLLINDQPGGIVTIPQTGVAAYTAKTSSFADGALVLQAFATTQAGGKSGLSNQLIVTKDTSAPLPSTEFTSLLSPTTDNPYLAIQVGTPAFHFKQNDHSLVATPTGWILGSANQTITISSSPTSSSTQTLNFTPQFTASSTSDTTPSSPAIFSALSTRITFIALTIVCVLLLLTIVIRIRIQHPSLIAHSAFVIMLAISLLLT